MPVRGSTSDKITSAQEAQEEDYDRAQLGGDESENDGGESHENVDDDGKMHGWCGTHVEKGVETRRLNKSRRTGYDDEYILVVSARIKSYIKIIYRLVIFKF